MNAEYLLKKTARILAFFNFLIAMFCMMISGTVFLLGCWMLIETYKWAQGASLSCILISLGSAGIAASIAVVRESEKTLNSK